MPPDASLPALPFPCASGGGASRVLCRVPGRELCTDGFADSRPCSEDQHCLHLIREDQRPRHWDREAQGYGGRYRGDWPQSKGRVGGRLPGGSGPTGEIWRMSRSYPGEEGGSSITARESGTCKGPEEKGRGESLCTGGGELPGSGWKAPQGWAMQGPASRVKDSCLYPTESGVFNAPAPAVRWRVGSKHRSRQGSARSACAQVRRLGHVL